MESSVGYLAPKIQNLLDILLLRPQENQIYRHSRFYSRVSTKPVDQTSAIVPSLAMMIREVISSGL